MIKSTCIFIFCLSWISLLSQDEFAFQEPKFDRHQIGINLISLLDRINKPKVDTLDDRLVYDLVYRFFPTRNFAISVGFGGNLRKKQEKYDVYSDVTTIDQRKFDVNLALEYHWSLSQRWKNYVSLDGNYGYTGYKSGLDSGFDRVIKKKDKSYYGSGLRLGIQYHILERLSIATEVGMTYIISTEKSKTYFDNFSDFDGPEQTRTGLDTYYYGPTSIYLNFKF
ncbi:MAG: outer membrane beta-barrel protein [Saprospiraceae bacterium]|nr:outer membrane beta-barrel protein [Saprospiraceae bacterium]